MDTWWNFLETKGLQFDRVLGVDEAGRGPLAGPVVVAGVILPKDHGIVGLNDSKMLKEAQREALFSELTQFNPSVPRQNGGTSPLRRGEVKTNSSVEIYVEQASAAVIDRDGILVVTKRLMRRIVKKAMPDIALIDAVNVDVYEILQLALVKGDQRVDCIAAASIIAKVTRDRMMKDYEKRYPGYGLAQHKGYGTAFHRQQLEEKGLSKVHRKTFCTSLLESTDHPP